MALYVGNKKLKINLGGKNFNLNLYSQTPITNGVRLLSSDNCTIKDSKGNYITMKEDK